MTHSQNGSCRINKDAHAVSIGDVASVKAFGKAGGNLSQAEQTAQNWLDDTIIAGIQEKHAQFP